MKDEKSSKEERGKNVEWFYSSLILYPSSLIFRCVYRSQHRARLVHRFLKLGGWV